MLTLLAQLNLLLPCGSIMAEKLDPPGLVTLDQHEGGKHHTVPCWPVTPSIDCPVHQGLAVTWPSGEYRLSLLPIWSVIGASWGSVLILCGFIVHCGLRLQWRLGSAIMFGK